MRQLNLFDAKLLQHLKIGTPTFSVGLAVIQAASSVHLHSGCLNILNSKNFCINEPSDDYK